MTLWTLGVRLDDDDSEFERDVDDPVAVEEDDDDPLEDEDVVSSSSPPRGEEPDEALHAFRMFARLQGRDSPILLNS
jgi:hypothetical protein